MLVHVGGVTFELRLVSLVLVIVSAGFLAGLGFWQLERGVWKARLIEARDYALALPAVKLPAAPSELLEYRHAEVWGVYLHDEEFYRPSGDIHGGGGGYHVLTPLRLDDGSLLLVNRGFIPLEWRGGTREGVDRVRVRGLIRYSSAPRFEVLAHDMAARIIFWVDVAAIKDALHKKDETIIMHDYYLDALRGEGGAGGLGEPIGGQTNLEFRDAHRMYAATWFALAFLLVIVALVRSARGHRRI